MRATCCLGPTGGKTVAAIDPGGDVDDKPTIAGRTTNVMMLDCDRTDESGGDPGGDKMVCINCTVLIPGRKPAGKVTATPVVSAGESTDAKIGSSLPGVMNSAVLSTPSPWPIRVIDVGGDSDSATDCGSTEATGGTPNGMA